MSIFEHVSVFISVILGLAVVHLLGGLLLTLDKRVKSRTYWVHLTWTFNMLFMTALVWIGNFMLAEVAAFSVWHFLNMVLYSMFIYLMSGLLYPVRGSDVTDFMVHFNDNRKRFYAIGLCLVLTDAVDGLLEQKVLGGDLNPGQFITLAVYAVLFIAGLLYNNRRFDGIVALVFLVGLFGFLESLIRVGVVKA